MKILKTSESVRNAITQLMQPGKTRRVAIVAFVGDGARAFLPMPKGVEIICWPKAGGTNPLELRRLKKMGARIRFVDGLHMKVYWASGRGAIITSANLSTNALGRGGLKEIGAFLPADAIDIDEILSSLQSRSFNKADMQKLENATKILPPPFRPKKTSLDYLEWYSQPARAEWKLGGWVCDDGGYAKKAKEIVWNYFNRREPQDGICCRQNEFQQMDWILLCRMTKTRTEVTNWMIVDYVVKVGQREKAYIADYPYQAIQVWTSKHYLPPPFNITKSFGAAFRNASQKYGAKHFENMRSTQPPEKLLQMIANEMKK